MLAHKAYRPWVPRQSYLLPPSPLEWLPEHDLAYFVLDLAGELDWSAITDRYQEKDARGTVPYHPVMMALLLLYAYCRGIASSRKIEQATYMDIGFRVLTGGQYPDHTCISEFRRVHLDALTTLFVQVLQLCQKAGLIKLGHVALDGTKMKANASKHKAMSYERMLKSEQELQAEIQRLLQEAEAVDHEEDAKYGTGRRGDELPDELRRRESRLQKIREAKAALEADAARTRANELEQRAEQATKQAKTASPDDKASLERKADQAQQKAQQAKDKAQQKAQARVDRAKAAAAKAAAEAKTAADRRRAHEEVRKLEQAEQERDKLNRLEPGEGDASESWPEHRVPCDAQGDPRATAQRNFTDPDSRIMKPGSEYIQGYNAQIAVDEEHQIIVACAVTNLAPDYEHLPPMLDQIHDNCGTYPEVAMGDAGYMSEDNVAACGARGVNPVLAVGRQKHGEGFGGAASEEPPAQAAMRRKLASPEGRALYARRKAIAEPPFGQIKEARGFRRFLLRGLGKVRGEWSLICTTHNLLKLFRSKRQGKSIVCATEEPAAA